MAITRRKAKIYALRWNYELLLNKCDLDTSMFSPYEAQKIYDAMDDLKESLFNRLQNLGDNPCLMPWNEDRIKRSIKQ